MYTYFRRYRTLFILVSNSEQGKQSTSIEKRKGVLKTYVQTEDIIKLIE